MKRIIYSIGVLVLGFHASIARAQGELSEGAQQLQNPLDPGGVATLSDLLAEVIKYLNIISAPIITIMILYGAFQMLFAQDNKTKYENGIKTIKHAAIGGAVVIVADGILYVVKDALSI